MDHAPGTKDQILENGGRIPPSSSAFSTSPPFARCPGQSGAPNGEWATYGPADWEITRTRRSIRSTRTNFNKLEVGVALQDPTRSSPARVTNYESRPKLMVGGVHLRHRRVPRPRGVRRPRRRQRASDCGWHVGARKARAGEGVRPQVKASGRA